MGLRETIVLPLLSQWLQGDVWSAETSLESHIAQIYGPGEHTWLPEQLRSSLRLEPCP